MDIHLLYVCQCNDMLSLLHNYQIGPVASEQNN